MSRGIAERHKGCRDTLKTQVIGGVPYVIHHLAPDTDAESPPDFSAFLAYLWAIVRDAGVAVFRGALEDYGCPTDFGVDEFGYRLEESVGLDEFFEGEDPQFTILKHMKLIRVQGLANAVTGCMVVGLEHPRLGQLLEVAGLGGFLVGASQSCRSICGAAGLDPQMMVHSVAVDTSADMIPFNHLWIRRLTQEELLNLGEHHKDRSEFLFAVGRCLGGLHNQRILCDAHEGNFVLDGHGNARMVDMGGVHYFLRNLRSPECAFNFIPLITSFSPPEWSWFKMGYIDRRGPAGVHVIKWVEKGHECRWTFHLDKGEYLWAQHELRVAMTEPDLWDDDELATMYADLGFCYARLQDPDKAISSYQLALGRLKDSADVRRLPLTFNLAKAYYRRGDLAHALDHFRQTLDLDSSRDEEYLELTCEAMIGAVECCRTLGREEDFRAALERLARHVRHFGTDRFQIEAGPAQLGKLLFADHPRPSRLVYDLQAYLDEYDALTAGRRSP